MVSVEVYDDVREVELFDGVGGVFVVVVGGVLVGL